MHVARYLLAIGVSACLFQASALADGAAEGSVSIRVTVPPIAETLEAQSTGAGGGWTVDAHGGGFMVGFQPGGAGESGESDQLSIYSGARNRVQVAYLRGGKTEVLQARRQESDGALQSKVYDVPSGPDVRAKSEMNFLFSPL
ncbi:hypothetical protein [Henriciella aquimarina]|uniref:hypothetical protein n=1 Tax=Henriciella aquimarina TaxID=545261 RepID=UPI0009FE127C|nr:hypothetical protein [Henriciella aquimarina]